MARHSGSLARSRVHGRGWTGGVRWVAQLLSWGITIAVARILSPADYGLAGMAALWTGFTQLLCEAGLAASPLRRRDNDAEALAQLGGVSAPPPAGRRADLLGLRRAGRAGRGDGLGAGIPRPGRTGLAAGAPGQ